MNLLIVIFKHFVFRALYFFVSLPGIVKGNDNDEENNKSKAKDKIGNALGSHYFLVPLIMRYRTTIATVGITVKAMVAIIEISMVSPFLRAVKDGCPSLPFCHVTNHRSRVTNHGFFTDSS